MLHKFCTSSKHYIIFFEAMCTLQLFAPKNLPLITELISNCTRISAENTCLKLFLWSQGKLRKAHRSFYSVVWSPAAPSLSFHGKLKPSISACGRKLRNFRTPESDSAPQSRQKIYPRCAKELGSSRARGGGGWQQGVVNHARATADSRDPLLQSDGCFIARFRLMN